MNIVSCADYDEMSRRAAESVLADLGDNTKMLLCATSGHSPLAVYQILAKEFKEDPEVFSEMRILMLDEWYGLPIDDPSSGKAFTQNNVIQPLSITKERFFYFESNAPIPEKECERISRVLKEQGPIDLCILGLGMNGHLGFNEPADSLTPQCHVAILSEATKKHAMISELASAPQIGMTLGMADILQSKKIILLLTGPSKGKVIAELLSRKISTHLPASLLWLHPNVDCYLDRTSCLD